MRVQRLFLQLMLLCLVSGCTVLAILVTQLEAGEQIESEAFESIENIMAGGTGKIKLSSEFVHEGKYSLKFTAEVNPHDALVAKSLPHAIDLSNYNALSFWIRPDVPDGTFALDVRLVIWDEAKKRGVWRTVGNINHYVAPNRRWSRHCFFIGKVSRARVLRLFDIVAWHHAPAHHENERVTFYLDDLRFISVPLAKKGLVVNGGFEQELIPWRIENVWRGGDVELDFDVRRGGQSSLRLSSSKGKPSRTISQTFTVEGGKWYQCSLWIRTKEADRAHALLTWQRDDPHEDVMRTYRSVSQRLCSESGTADFTYVSRIVKAPAAAQRATLTLETSGGTAWFDEMKIEEIKGSVDELSWLGMPPKQTFYWQQEVKLPASVTSPSISSFRIALEPQENQPFRLQLSDPRKTRVPLIRFDGKIISARDGQTWKSLPGVFQPRRSIVIYVELSRRAFAFNSSGIVLPWWGPFKLEQTPENCNRVLIEGSGTLRRLLIEGPLWTSEEVERRRKSTQRMELTFQKGTGWIVPSQKLPKDLRVEGHSPVSSWTMQAVILHTAMPFTLLKKNLRRIKDMGFNTLCLRPVQPSGRVGFGSSCCVQDYFAVDSAKGGATALKALVAEAHQFDMRVIFWLVPNHSASSNPAFYERPELYFTDAGSFRSAWFDVVDFDYSNPETWRFFAKVGRFWISEFDIDGFGLDVPDLLPRSFVRYFKHELVRAKGGDVFVVGESSGAHVNEWGMDCRYGFLSAFQMREILEGVTPPAKAPQQVIERLVKRLYPHETIETFGPFGGNVGIKRWIEQFGSERAKCTAVVMATLPLIPEVLAGPALLQEHSEDDPYGFVVKMLQMRKLHPSLSAASVEMVEHDQPMYACAYLKRGRGEWALVVINFASQQVSPTLEFPAEVANLLRKSTSIDLLTGNPPLWQWRNDNHVSLPMRGCSAVVVRIKR